jgi:predicted transcriptional regulator
LSQAQREDIMKGIEEIENGEIVDYEDFDTRQYLKKLNKEI